MNKLRYRYHTSHSCPSLMSLMVSVDVEHHVYLLYISLPLSFGWLKWFNAELSPKSYWRGPRSQEVGEEGVYDT